MSANAIASLAASAAVVFAALAVLFAALARRARREAAAAAEARDRIADELDRERAVAAVREEESLRREEERERHAGELLREKESAFAEAVRTLREQFANLAADALRARSVELGRMNCEQLEGVLRPVREQMERLGELTRRAQTESANLGAGMTRDVAAVRRIADELARTADALASNTRFQGRRGEDILAEKLRQAGLEEGVSFFLQRGCDTDRPDAQVCDPENRWLVIDSKVSLTAYLEWAEATDEAVRREKLAAHLASVRQKIDQLAKKRYPAVFAAEHPDRDYLPVTAMFVPWEAPLTEALRAEPALWQRAVQGNVILVTPLTLMAYLRLVYLAWQHERESANQAEIVATARELLARMNGFLLAFERIEGTLEALSGACAEARGMLVDAPRAQTIAKSARKLIDLGVRLENRRGRRAEQAKCLSDVEG